MIYYIGNRAGPWSFIVDWKAMKIATLLQVLETEGLFIIVQL